MDYFEDSFKNILNFIIYIFQMIQNKKTANKIENDVMLILLSFLNIRIKIILIILNIL